MVGDVLSVEGDAQPGEPLLRPVMRGGEPIVAATLEDARRRAAAELARLPGHLRRLAVAPPYPVEIAERLRALARAVDREAT
jgi:nicotinate phosphoribosyltransferase